MWSLSGGASHIWKDFAGIGFELELAINKPVVQNIRHFHFIEMRRFFVFLLFCRLGILRTETGSALARVLPIVLLLDFWGHASSLGLLHIDISQREIRDKDGVEIVIPSLELRDEGALFALFAYHGFPKGLNWQRAQTRLDALDKKTRQAIFLPSFRSSSPPILDSLS